MRIWRYLLSADLGMTFGDLPNLTSLPDSLGNLSLLQKLDIIGCPKLTCLPTSIQSLTVLKSLIIYKCHELEKRCETETGEPGEDWPKISHIHNIEFRERRVIGFFLNLSPTLNAICCNCALSILL